MNDEKKCPSCGDGNVCACGGGEGSEAQTCAACSGDSNAEHTCGGGDSEEKTCGACAGNGGEHTCG